LLKEGTLSSYDIALQAVRDRSFDDLHPVVSPSPPHVLQIRRREMAELKPGEVIDEDPAFWRMEEITNFQEDKWKANLKNKDNFNWLNWLKRHLKPTDTAELIKVRNRIYEYVQYFQQEKEPPFRVLRAEYEKKG